MVRHDPIEEAFGILKACSTEQSRHQLELEEKLMSLQSHSKSWRMPTIVLAAITVSSIVVAGIAEATTGAVSNAVSVFIDLGHGYEKVEDAHIDEDGKLQFSLDGVDKDNIKVEPNPGPGEPIAEIKLKIETPNGTRVLSEKLMTNDSAE